MKATLKWLMYVFLTPAIANAQDDKTRLEQLIRDDSSDVNIIAGYPDKIKNNIFIVATEPEAIMCIGDIQEKTKEDFRKLVSSYSKDEQAEIWNLTRFDGLLREIVRGGKKSKDDVEDMLKKYPAEAHDAAMHYSQKHFSLLTSIDHINRNFENSLEDLIRNFPTATRFAFTEIIKEPEAVSILNQNIRLTIRLGEIYTRNPSLVVQEFDSLSLDLAREKAKETQEWKETLKNNPDAADELKKSAKEYAKENGYKDYDETDPVVIEHYYFHPYPYWCGYPWWYEYDYWQPYPYWYHWGFYYWQGDIVWMGVPSWYFMHWHFHHYWNFYEYPHITNVYINHYYGHRGAAGSNARIVNQWVRNNEKKLPRDFISNAAKRPDRIKEYGKFEIDYVKHVMGNSRPDNRNDFMQHHATDYPNLQPAKDKIKPIEPVPVKTPIIRNVTPKPVVKPAVKPVIKEPYKPRGNQPQKPATIQQPKK